MARRQCQAGEVRAVRGGNLHPSLFCNFSRRVNQKVPDPTITYACTSEKWFQPLLQKPQCFLSPRTNYYLPDGSVKKGVTKGSVVTNFGADVSRFREAFASLGVVKI
jgi:hypothetical protein